MSIAWNIVEREAKNRIEAIRDNLETATGDDIVRLQAQVKAWRNVLLLPDELAAKAESQEHSGYRT